MFEAAINRAEQRAFAGLAGLVENPHGSYGWKLPAMNRMQKNLDEWAYKSDFELSTICGFGACCNCMLGGSRYKVSGIW